MAVTITIREASGPSIKAAADEIILYLVRHGYGSHNAFAASVPQPPCNCRTGGSCAYINPAHVDARLIEKGRRQAVAAGCRLRSLSPAPAIAYVSPLRRTLETASIALAGSGGTGAALDLPMVACEEIREVYGVHHCDRRGPIVDARAEWPAVDYSAVGTDEDSWFKDDVRETVEEAVERATKFLLTLRARPERVVVAVTHSAFLREMLTHAVVVEEGHSAVRRRFDTGEVRPVVVSYRDA
ncbi:hypothetical protein MMPV_009284 [Pyropia vietnamensis]